MSGDLGTGELALELAFAVEWGFHIPCGLINCLFSIDLMNDHNAYHLITHFQCPLHHILGHDGRLESVTTVSVQNLEQGSSLLQSTS